MSKSTPYLEKPLPNSIEAERCVLGAILLDNDKLAVVVDNLAPEDFFFVHHQRLFKEMLTLFDDRKPIDTLTLTDSLHRKGELEAAGGASYLSSLIDGVPRISNVGHYAQIVREKALLRGLVHQAHAIQQRAIEGQEDSQEILDKAEYDLQALIQLQKSLSKCGDGVTYRQAGYQLWASLTEENPVRVCTGIGALDDLTGGFRSGEFIVFTAETGVGKTLLAQQTRRAACDKGLHSLYASAEMLAERLLARELASEAGIKHWKMRRPEHLTVEERARIAKVGESTCIKCRILDGEISLQRISRAARQMKNDWGLDLLIVDYDELVDSPGRDETDQLRNLARGLKLLAMKLPCVVVLISQLTKARVTQREIPTLRDLYSAMAKVKHAHIVVCVIRKYVQELEGDETEATIAVLKNRDGNVGHFKARFDLARLRFAAEADASLQPPPPQEEESGQAPTDDFPF